VLEPRDLSPARTGIIRLILHADDFGMNTSVTNGILCGFRNGLLTSTSLLANAPDADRAISLWKRLLADFAAGALPSVEIRRRLDDPTIPFDLGVHLNLTQGRPLSGDAYPPELLDRGGRFPGVFALFCRLRRCRHVLLRKVRDELSRQIEFTLDRGIQPTHLNGHQYIEMLPAITPILPELMDRYRIGSIRVAEEPYLLRTTLLAGFAPHFWAMAHVKRHFARRFHHFIDRLGLGHSDRFHGTAHAGRISLNLMRQFAALPSPNGRGAGGEGEAVEIGLHPATAPSEISPDDLVAGWRDPLARSRPSELRLLTSPALADLLVDRKIHLGRLRRTDC
jgi:predicted glycoside hydrolase/deacetylase ChbG (UPF0249 family)